LTHNLASNEALWLGHALKLNFNLLSLTKTGMSMSNFSDDAHWMLWNPQLSTLEKCRSRVAVELFCGDCKGQLLCHQQGTDVTLDCLIEKNVAPLDMIPSRFSLLPHRVTIQKHEKILSSFVLSVL